MKRMISDFIIALLLFMTGISLLILPIFQIRIFDWILFGILIGYAMLKLFQFIITIEDKNYEGLYITILSILVGVLGIKFHLFEVPLRLAMTLLFWVTGLSLFKLKQADYFHDHHNVLWKFSMVELVIFIIISVVTSINLYHLPQIQMIVLGFFFMIYGLLEMWNPLIFMLIGEGGSSESSK